MVVGKPNLIKKYNSTIIHEMISEHGPVSKPELVSMTALSLPTVNKLVGELVSLGLVQEGQPHSSVSAGRRAKTYISNDDAGYVVTLFYTAKEWIGGLCNLAGSFEEQEHFSSSSDQPDVLLADLKAACKRLSGSCKGQVIGVGLGIPGVVEGDCVTSIPQIPCWEGTRLRTILEESFNLPVFIENDVKLLTVGYYARECPNTCENLLFLSIGNGLGSGMILNQKLYKGANCFAGECGYMVVDENCLLSGKASLEQRICYLAQRIQAGDDSAKTDYFRLIARILVNFITVIDPQRIAIQGTGIDTKAVRFMEQEMRQYLPCKLPHISIVNGEEIGLYGAYRLCFANTIPCMKFVEQRGI